VATLGVVLLTPSSWDGTHPVPGNPVVSRMLGGGAARSLRR
jgi:hypothetical protein